MSLFGGEDDDYSPRHRADLSAHNRESTMRYRDIVFMQDSEGREVCDTIELFGTTAAYEHLLQWEHGDNDGELRETPPWGSRDNVETFGEYVMAWNHGLGYVGLVRLEHDDD